MKPTIKNYTLVEIADRFEEAAYTLRRLPSVRMKGYFSTWPPIVRTVMENLQAEVEPMRLGPPSAESISRMEETIQWIFLLDREEERRLIWLRAAKVPWKPICWRLGCGRTTAYHMWRTALLQIAFRLNTSRNGGRNVRTKKD
jgi:Domain of unknown function (DUF6362)